MCLWAEGTHSSRSFCLREIPTPLCPASIHRPSMAVRMQAPCLETCTFLLQMCTWDGVHGFVPGCMIPSVSPCMQ